MVDDLCFTQAVELVAGLRARERSPVELTQALLDRVERVNPKINAFVTLRREEALAEARHAEDALIHGDPDTLGALFGPSSDGQGPHLDRRRAHDVRPPGVQGPHPE